MNFILQPVSEQDARDIASWQYQPPYSMYDLSAKDIPDLLTSRNRYFSVRDESEQLVGYCCFGNEAKVPGGDYTAGEPEVIDVGIGMNPGLIGKGLGEIFVSAIIGFATEEFSPRTFRVSIAAFNKRSQKTFLNLGFVKTHQFSRDGDGMKFLQFERDVESLRNSKSIK
jgi:RimJ/RimL family protein N-acetyltransferase